MDDFLEELRTKASIPPWPTWGKLNGLSKGTTYALCKQGKVEGLYKVGHQYRIATAPWRKRLGLEGEAA